VKFIQKLIVNNKIELYYQYLLLVTYEVWNFNSGNYLFTTDTK